MSLVSTSREFKTGNKALVTALVTAGFRWHSDKEPCQNIYANGTRPVRDVRNRLKELGKVTYAIARKHPSGVDLDRALEAYDGATSPGEELDAAIEAITDTAVRDEIKKLLTLAYVESSRNTLANLREVKEAPHTVQAHIQIKKPDGLPVIVGEFTSPETLRGWGIEKTF